MTDDSTNGYADVNGFAVYYEILGAGDPGVLLHGGAFGDLAGLPDARLAVLPGITHVGLISRADCLAPMIDEFLDAPEG